MIPRRSNGELESGRGPIWVNSKSQETMWKSWSKTSGFWFPEASWTSGSNWSFKATNGWGFPSGTGHGHWSRACEGWRLAISEQALQDMSSDELQNSCLQSTVMSDVFYHYTVVSHSHSQLSWFITTRTLVYAKYSDRYNLIQHKNPAVVGSTASFSTISPWISHLQEHPIVITTNFDSSQFIVS